MDIKEVILDAIFKQIETNPERIISLVEKIIDLIAKHPELGTALVGLLTKKAVA